MKTNEIYPTYKHEAKLMDHDGFSYVIGVDEAGRGPGAGPVVAGAAFIPRERVKTLYGRVKDSKKMTKKQLNKMYVALITSIEYGTGIVDNETIDRINILEATKQAMEIAISKLPRADYYLIDGNMKFHHYKTPYESIIKGDQKSLSIASAAVIAKVTRDRLMIKLHEEYPVYGWDTNKGYLSKKHIEAIKKYGPSPYHRMSFKKVGH